MSSTILSKGLNKLSLNNTSGPTNEDYIRNLDYDFLEEKYNIHKYYPRFFHNDSLSPELRELIADKPIYAKANQHVTKEQRKEQRRAQIQQMKKEQRQADRARQEYDIADMRSRPRNVSYAGKPVGNLAAPGPPPAAVPMAVPKQAPPLFRNPFDSNQPTLIDDDNSGAGAVRANRHNSIAGKFMSFIRGKTDSVDSHDENENVNDNENENENDNSLTVSKSYDQTKSNMTSSRKRPNIIKLKFNELTNRKYADQIGMYFFH